MGEQAAIFHLDIPLKRPFTHASGVVESRSIALVRLGSGPPFGWGEAAPFPGQDESIKALLHAARTAGATPTLSAALGEARADKAARLTGESLSETVGATEQHLPVSLAVGLAGDPLRIVEQAVGEGVTRFKLKIAPGRVEHVTTIRARFPGLVIGVDANGSFDGETTGELSAMRDLDILYVEQPTSHPGSDAAHELRDFMGIPVFADESVRSVADAERVLAFDSVDGVVVKPGRLGWLGALAVRELADAVGKRWRASGLLETGVGRGYTDTLAACPGAFLSDVAPAEWFLESDVTDSRYHDGRITVPSAPGLGIEPDFDVLDRYLVERIDLN